MNMKARFIILMILIVAFARIAVADGQRDIPYADVVPFLGIEEAAKVFKKAVCAIQVPDKTTDDGKMTNWISLGSGFLVKGERNAVLAVTCKHVVNLAAKLQKPLHIGLDTDKGYRRFPCNIAYIDPLQDIAILAPQRDVTEELNLQSLYVDKEMFDDDSSLVEGRGVIIPGYPLSLGLENDQNHPVVRFGIIAQYTGKDYFLLDGVASHGNSGSPVFALKYKENKLIGMVTSYQADTIILYDESGEARTNLPYNSALARCITIRTIAKAIDNAKY